MDFRFVLTCVVALAIGGGNATEADCAGVTRADAPARTLKVLEFKEYGDEMRAFIESCMAGKDESDFDIVSGPFLTDEIIAGRKFEGSMLQICFRTENAIARCLNFEKAIIIQ